MCIRDSFYFDILRLNCLQKLLIEGKIEVRRGRGKRKYDVLEELMMDEIVNKRRKHHRIEQRGEHSSAETCLGTHSHH